MAQIAGKKLKQRRFLEIPEVHPEAMKPIVTKNRKRKSFPIHIIVFLAPATLIYTIFMIYPLIDSLRLSFFTTPELGGPEVFAGIENYYDLLQGEVWSERFWGALKNNFLYFAIHMLVQNSIALLLAGVLTTRRLRTQVAYRTLIFMPTTLSVVIVGFIWQLILSPLWGITEGLMGVVGLQAYFEPWLGLESSALITLALISVWQFIGIPFLLFYAALIAIPDELVEAAYVDGAANWSVFWRIKFPLILPTLGIVTILTYVGSFNAFDLIYTVKGAWAEPNYSTDVLGTFFYRTFFGNQLQVGNATMGATIAAIMFVIILSGVLFYMFAWAHRVTIYEL